MPPPIINVTSHVVIPEDGYSSRIVLQITSLTNSYMVWIGVVEETPEDAGQVPLKGRLAYDWACAMPAASANSNSALLKGSTTSLFASASNASVTRSMAQRLACKFGKQIFLSLDVPLQLFTKDGKFLEVEKQVLVMLKELNSRKS